MSHLDENQTRKPRRPTRRRALSAILAELEALPVEAFARVWDYLRGVDASYSPSVRRYLTGLQRNLEPVAVLATTINDFPRRRFGCVRRQLIAALWAQDNPTALVAPPWFPALSIRGDVDL